MIYFDNAASTIIEDDILELFKKESKLYFANPSSNNALGNLINNLVINAKNNILNNLNLNNKEYEVIFTSGATESNNLALFGYARKNKNKGNNIITSKIEHASILNPLNKLKEEGFNITYLDLNKEGLIDINYLKENINQNTILISLIGVNNETGNILNLDEVSKLIKSYPKIKFHVDLAQGAIKINFDLSNFDLITLSSYKLGGLKGIGALIKRKNINLSPIIYGGGQENNLRSGTINYPLISTFSYAINKEYKLKEENYKYVKSLRDLIILKIKEDPYLNNEILIHDYKLQSPYILSLSLKNKTSSVLVEALSNKEIYVSTKSSCSDKLNKESYVIYELTKSHNEALNSIRLSFSRLNKKEECLEFIKVLKEELIKLRG